MPKKSPVDVKVPPGELESYPHPGLLPAEVLKEEGVEYIFGVWGGHMWPWLDPIIKERIQHITVHHEQCAAYAAEAYARVTGKVGVCCGTVGPGVTNLYSGLHQAHLSNTPVVALMGGHEANDDGTYTLQECYAEKLYESFAKLSKRLIDASTYKFWIKRAFIEARKEPCGVSVIEFELNALTGPYKEQAFYVPNWLKEPMREPMADPKDIEKAIDLIYSCDKPAMYVGDGAIWSNCQDELREFVELAKVPVMGRRGGRGVLPETHPLIWRSAQIGVESELFILIGARLDFFDFFGQRFNIQRAIQINKTYKQIHPWLPTELAIEASPKVVLRQMINYIKEHNPPLPKGREEWLKKVEETEKSRQRHLEERALQFKDEKPIHALWMSKVICDVIEDMYKGECYMIWDSFTGSNKLSPYFKARFTGQVLDAGPQAGVGHGIGQAIGVALATKKQKPVFVMLGDAGIGNNGMDIETALRHKLPIVYCVFNNDGWIGGSEIQYGKDLGWYNLPDDWVKPHFFLPKLRYDKMFEEIGCYGEFCEDPNELRGALERSFKAAEKGQTAVLNLYVSKKPIQNILDSRICAIMWKHLPWNETTRYMRKMRRKFLPDMFPFDKYGIEEDKWDREAPTDDDYELGIPED